VTKENAVSEKSIATQTTQPIALKPAPAGALLERIERIRQEIARRAFEIFESEGGLFGRDMEHWFKAEAELLHPVHTNITESDDTLTVQAEVPGFQPDELEVSVEQSN
jgi:HSP20 family molecular chaperone IbpA